MIAIEVRGLARAAAPGQGMPPGNRAFWNNREGTPGRPGGHVRGRGRRRASGQAGPGAAEQVASSFKIAPYV